MTVTVVHVLGALDRDGVESAAPELCRGIPSTERASAQRRSARMGARRAAACPDTDGPARMAGEP